MYLSYSDIMKEFKKPLEYKIQKALEAIAQGFAVSGHNAAIAFSGGKDSTVLWHLIRVHFPEKTPYICFCNTGVEYPESLEFARRLGSDWGGAYFRETVLSRTASEGFKYEAQREILDFLIDEGRVREVLKADGKLKSTAALERMATTKMRSDFLRRKLVWPKGTLMSYWWCCDQYGFPILGKAASLLSARRINIDCFLTFSKSVSSKPELLDYYEVLKSCRFSQHCCTVLKKDPALRLNAELDIDVLFKGLLVSESQTRKLNFSKRGYWYQSHRPYLGGKEGDPFWQVNPLQIWTDTDIWEYIRAFDVPYSVLYERGYTDQKGIEQRIPRNGCYGCATAILRKNNQLSMLRRTHPKLWRAVMDYGMAAELKKLYHAKNNGIPSIVGVFENPQDLLETRPCAFDDIFKNLDTAGIESEHEDAM